IDSRLLDQYHIDWFHELNRALSDQLDDDAFAARITGNVGRMGWLAAETLARARAGHADIDDHGLDALLAGADARSEEHTSYLQSLMRLSYAVFCLIKKK